MNTLNETLRRTLNSSKIKTQHPCLNESLSIYKNVGSGKNMQGKRMYSVFNVYIDGIDGEVYGRGKQRTKILFSEGERARLSQRVKEYWPMK